MLRSSLTAINAKFKFAVIVSSIIIIAYLAINIFVIGGDQFVYTLNNFITIPLAIITTLFAFSLWKLVSVGTSSRILWGNLMVGWAFWTTAEILWVVYGYLFQEVPYPSLADFFWLVGYIPIGYGLYKRLRVIPLRLNPMQRWGLWGVLTVTILFTWIFVVNPTIQSNDTSDMLQSSLNIIYPVADLLLLMWILRLFFIFTSGDQGVGWILITIGFLAHSLSNLIFSYAVLFDLYYPGLKVNLFSGTLVDAPYNISYLFWLVGLYALHLTWRQYRPFETILQPKPIPNTSILVFLGGDDKVIETSNNFSVVFGVNDVHGKSLSELLQIPEGISKSILERMRKDGQIVDYPLQLSDSFGGAQGVYIIGSVLNPSGEYRGCVLLFRILFEQDYSLDQSLSDYQKSMVSHLRKLCDSDEHANIRKLLMDYYLVYLKRLYNISFQSGGAQVSSAFLEYLQRTAFERNWPLQFSPKELIMDGDYQLSMVRESLPVLLQMAKNLACELTDPKTVENEMELVSSQFSESIHRNIAFFSQ